MANINRPAKNHGGTDYRAGDTILSTEVNLDLDTIYGEFSGSIDDENISASAGIDPTKIDDYSATNPEANTVLTPGDTATPAKALNLPQELSMLRHNDLTRGVGISVQYRTSTGTYADIGPWEEVPTGPNIITNGSLQTYNTGSGTPPSAAPDGWTLVGVPDTCTLTSTPVSEGDWQTLQIISDTTGDEGITQTVTGVKASTKYIVGVRGRAVSGTGAVISVTGGITSGDYRAGEIAFTAASGAFHTEAIVVKTNSTPDDLVVALQTSGTGAVEFHVHDVFCYELARDHYHEGTFAPVHIRKTTETSYVFTDALVWTEITELTVSTKVPYSGLMLEYSCDIPIYKNLDAPICRLTENGTVVAGPSVHGWVTASGATILSAVNHISFRHVNMNPTPNTTYTYKFEVYDSIASTAFICPSGASLVLADLGSVDTAGDVWLTTRRAI